MVFVVNLHLFGLLLMVFSCGKCQNETEVQEKEEVVLDVAKWKIVRYIRTPKDESGVKHRIFCNDCLNSKEWKGLRIDIFFEPTITEIKARNILEKRYRRNSRNFVITAREENSIPKEGGKPFCEFYSYYYFKIIPSERREITSFYVNRQLLYGIKLIDDKRAQGTSILGRRQCSIYAKLPENISGNKGKISFDYFSLNFQGGLFVVLIFQQVLKTVNANNLYTSQQEENQWTLENYGYILNENETLKIEIELEAENLLIDPYPLAIILNDEILCGLPAIDVRPSKPSFSYKDIKEIQNLNKGNNDLLLASLTLTCLLTLLVIGCISYIVYLRNFYRHLVYKNSEINETLESTQGNKQQRSFDDFVQAEYVNL